MATRKTYVAQLRRLETGALLGETTAYAWNSAIRASEALVREHARAAGCMFEGDAVRIITPPIVKTDRMYERVWAGNGEKVAARVWEVSA